MKKKLTGTLLEKVGVLQDCIIHGPLHKSI